MGKLAVYKYFSFMILLVTFLVAAFTISGLFGGSANPASSTALALLVYALPLLIIANLVLLVFWLIRRRWIWAVIPTVTLLCCIPYVGTIYQLPFNSDSNAEKANGLKIATYNVARFGRETSGFKAEDILAEMKKEKVDVLCFQEYFDVSGDKLNSNSYKEYFPYMAKGREDMIIYSRYPIKKSKTITFEETNNSAMWADVDINGRELRIFNVHLQTTGINRTLHQAAKYQERGVAVSENALLRAIFGNYLMGMLFRGGQAITIANEQRMTNIPCIVCGDLNDVPYSYVYETVKGNLKDGFRECGEGFMYTFRGTKKVRIDYIFHDKDLQGLTYYKKDLSYSDHYPVFMKIEL